MYFRKTDRSPHSLVATSLVVGVLGSLAACKSTNNKASQTKGIFSSPDTPDYTQASGLDLNEEYVPPEEAGFMAAVGSRFHTVHAKQQATNVAKVGDQNGLVWRGMHAKAHGCVTGKMVVTVTDPQYQHGIFAAVNRSYDVVGRFSNGSGLLQADSERDLRGFALKVQNIDAPYLPQAPVPGNQDFLMTNGAKHHARDIVELMGFVEASAAGGLHYANFMATHPLLATTLLQQTGRHVDSMVSEAYWSRAAFTLGPDLSIKYLARPCSQVVALNPTSTDADRLTADFDYQFAQEGAVCFNLFAQAQLDPVTEPIENHQIEWKTGEVQLAQVTFPSQTPDRGATCEGLTFNPWNGHQDMRPLGNMNRGRSPIYQAAEGYRQGK